MKQFLASLYLNKYFLTFIVIFAYLESIQVRYSSGRTINWYVFTPEAAVGQLMNALLLFVIIGLVIQRFDSRVSLMRALAVFLISMLIYVLANNLLSYIVALSFGTVARNFNVKSLTSSNIKYVMDVFVYGGLFLAHYYFQKNQEDKKKISKLEKVQIETQLSKLKAQLDPHFLFNNLNVLDQLIEEDQQKASVFLHDFSEIYRYVLRVSDQQLITVAEECAFAQHYFDLMQQKYGDSYTFTISGQAPSEACLPPLSLQLLLENAIEHNLGTAQYPVQISVCLEENSLTMQNNLRSKKSPKVGGGRALENLCSQYKLLGNSMPAIEHTATAFTIRLPYIYAN